MIYSKIYVQNFKTNEIISNPKDNETAEASYELLKTDIQVIDINFCNSSSSYEYAMKPGMFCTGRLDEGLLNDILIIIFWIKLI